MKKLSLSISMPDNGGITFFGPLAAPSSTKLPYTYDKQRMYICANQDPLQVGQTLLAMLADLQMSEPLSSIDTEVDIKF